MVNTGVLSPEDVRKGQEKIKEEIYARQKNWAFRQMTFAHCLMEYSISKAIVSLRLVSCGY